VHAPIAGGEEDVAASRSERHAHAAVEHIAVGGGGLVAVVVLEEINAPVSEGLGVLIFMTVAARISRAGANTLHPTLGTLHPQPHPPSARRQALPPQRMLRYG
jgi:hypothetical protein